MIWHIFKKDVKLTWPLAAVVAALHWTMPVLLLMTGNSSPGRRLDVLINLLMIGGWLGSGFLITAAVHQDAVPGIRQDWLVRPIRRRDLLLAKLLFTVLAVQLPVFASDTIEALLMGFSPGASFNAAFQRSCWQMLLINAAFLAFASITRNLLEAITGGVSISFAVASVWGLTSGGDSTLQPVMRSSLEWIGDSTMIAVLAVGAGAILILQYFRRRTDASRILTGLVVVMILLTAFMPWRPAFALQRSLSSVPGSSSGVGLNFDSAAGRFRIPVGALTPDDVVAIERGVGRQLRVYLPIRVVGLPPGTAVVSDRAEVRLVTADGVAQALTAEGWNVRREGAGIPDATVYPPIGVPAAFYRRIKDQRVRIEAEYWLTLVRMASAHALPPLGGSQRIPDVGWCRTSVNDEENATRFVCFNAGMRPVCVNYFLVYPPTGQRNPDRFGCADYTPFVLNLLSFDAITRYGANLPFRDLTGLARFPVDGSKMPESRAVLQTYRVQEHFMRKVVVPEVRLGDWGPATPGA